MSSETRSEPRRPARRQPAGRAFQSRSRASRSGARLVRRSTTPTGWATCATHAKRLRARSWRIPGIRARVIAAGRPARSSAPVLRTQASRLLARLDLADRPRESSILRVIRGHRQISDIYLLGLAKKMGGYLATFDAGIPLSAVDRRHSQHYRRHLARRCSEPLIRARSPSRTDAAFREVGPAGRPTSEHFPRKLPANSLDEVGTRLDNAPRHAERPPPRIPRAAAGQGLDGRRRAVARGRHRRERGRVHRRQRAAAAKAAGPRPRLASSGSNGAAGTTCRTTRATTGSARARPDGAPVRATFSYPMFQHFRSANQTMTDLAGTRPRRHHRHHRRARGNGERADGDGQLSRIARRHRADRTHARRPKTTILLRRPSPC